MSKRFFAFGCSFTHWHWPTWADILGRQFDHWENWGSGGGGNLFIHNQLNIWSQTAQPRPEDTVIIMWTNIYRDEHYQNNQWLLHGNIYGRKDVRPRFDSKGFLLRDLALINSARLMLEHLKVRYLFLSMVPLWNIDQFSKVEMGYQDAGRLMQIYQDTINIIRPSIFETVFKNDWYSRSLLPTDWVGPRPRSRFDAHATTKEHLEYLDLVATEIPIPHADRQWVDRVEHEIRQPALGQDCFDQSTYRPWVHSLHEKNMWQWQEPIMP